MRIITLYMARRFFKPFLFGLGIFALLIFLGDLFDKMSYLMRSKAPAGILLQWLWLEVPYWTVRVIPMATLLATLVAVTGFVQSGEWIALQASGFESKDFWLPLLGCALVVSVLSFSAQETVLPACYRRARRLWQERINPQWEWEKFSDVALVGAPGLFVQAKLFLPKEGRMERAVLEKAGPSGIERQWDAAAARWDGMIGRWVFVDGVERSFAGGKVSEKPFERVETELTLPPRQLVPKPRSPDEMSLRELGLERERRRLVGQSARDLTVAAWQKTAYPFTNLVICALGIPLAMRLRAKGKVVSFCAALAVSFLFLWFLEIGRALGGSGTFPPALAAWGPNLLFGGLAAWMIRRYA